MEFKRRLLKTLPQIYRRHFHNVSPVDLFCPGYKLTEYEKAMRIPWFEEYHINAKVKQSDEDFEKSGMAAFFRKVNILNEIAQKGYFTKRSAESELRHRLHLQRHIPLRSMVLRSDLAASHFIVYRGGKVKICGEDSWITNYFDLPRYYIPGMHVHSLDCEGTDLMYEGLRNILYLRNLRVLSLRGLKELDAFCFDLISSHYGQQLTSLDISYTNLKIADLSCFYRFENLKTLKVFGISDEPEYQYAYLMLEEALPSLTIEGVQYSYNLDEVTE